jgi:hypothetical protein
MYLPDVLNAVPQIDITHHIDKRDGFPVSFLNDDIIIVGDPVQFHMRPSDQQVIGVLANEILNGDEIGKHYKMIASFSLDNNVTAKVFEKISPLDKKSIDYLRNIFYNLYPNYPSLYDIQAN